MNGFEVWHRLSTGETWGCGMVMAGGWVWGIKGRGK